MEANRTKNGGKVKMPELGKELSQMWAQLGAEEKAKFEKMASDAKEKHGEAMKEFAEATKIEGFMKRPQSAYFQYINANREKIKEEHKLTSIGDIGKKAAELWKAMSDEDKKPYEDQYRKDKATYEAWKESDAGKEALAKHKALKGGKTEEDDASPKKSPKKGTNKRASSKGEDEENVAKKAKTVSTPSGRGKGRGKGANAKKAVQTQLSESILAKCSAMGVASSGVQYQTLLEKLLTTEGLANCDQERALEMLKDNDGLLNKVRSLLLASGGA